MIEGHLRTERPAGRVKMMEGMELTDRRLTSAEEKRGNSLKNGHIAIDMEMSGHGQFDTFVNEGSFLAFTKPLKESLPPLIWKIAKHPYTKVRSLCSIRHDLCSVHF